MKYVKNQIYNTHYSSSTIPKGTMAELGTIEKDACSYFGKHNKKEFQGYETLKYAIKNLDFDTVLDVGTGEGYQASFLKKEGKSVSTCDFDNISGAHCMAENEYTYKGDFLQIDFEKKFDFVLASHVLEHQRNVGNFIDKLSSVTKNGGYICVVVPIRKPFVTGGHLSIWNPGLLLYNFVTSGIDCSKVYLSQMDYDIGLIVKNTKYNIDKFLLTYDRGDVDLLMNHFPFDLKEPFNGDIMYIDTLKKKKNE